MSHKVPEFLLNSNCKNLDDNEKNENNKLSKNSIN